MFNVPLRRAPAEESNPKNGCRMSSHYLCPGCDSVVFQINGKGRHLTPVGECRFNHENLDVEPVVQPDSNNRVNDSWLEKAKGAVELMAYHDAFCPDLPVAKWLHDLVSIYESRKARETQ